MAHEHLDPLLHHELEFLEPYLPNATCSGSSPPIPNPNKDGLPFITLTYATSLDSHIAAAPGLQTKLSGSHSKRMTHTLRSYHHGILVGAGTAVTDDPGLNCRIDLTRLESGCSQPRPVILDPSGRWLSTLTKDARMLQCARAGRGLGPWVYLSTLTDGDWIPAAEELLEEHGGRLIRMRPERDIEADIRESDGVAEHFRFSWKHLFRDLYSGGLQSVMVEGGGMVINSLLKPENSGFISTVLVTIAPTYLGTGGLHISPDIHGAGGGEEGKSSSAIAFKDVKWTPLGDDVIFTGRINKD